MKIFIFQLILLIIVTFSNAQAQEYDSGNLSYLKLLANVAFGQTLPTVVDNSQWFPPVRSQEAISNCTHFSLIYYLKSAIWNRKFNRDPKLEVNQFNENFVWNQNINPIYQNSEFESAFNFMKTQGCATIADFPANEQTTEVKPSIAVREKALAYKSKELIVGDFFECRGNANLISQKIDFLKDALAKGNSFTLGISLFKYFNKMTSSNNVYNCYPGMSPDSVFYGHMFTIVGYNDTIKTAFGRGAFQVINSNVNPAQGHFYLDYNWFYFATWQIFDYCFLEEDFDSQPQLSVSLDLRSAVSGKSLSDAEYTFVDTTFNSQNKKVDFVDFFDYLRHRNHVQIIKVNDRALKLRSNTITMPYNSKDGNYELVTDISNLTSASAFKNLEIIVFDPVSANYIGANGQSFYSYARTANSSVSNPVINFIGTSKKIVGQVKNLSDTTIVATDFYTNIVKPVGNTDPWIYVKSCTSVLKRKLITFSIADVQTNASPVFTQVPSGDILTQDGSTATFTFQASDLENNAITYSITSGTGASINSNTGLFSYPATQMGNFYFTVNASDGVSSASMQFKVKVGSQVLNFTPVFVVEPPIGWFVILQGDMVKCQFKALDPEGQPITYSLEDLSGVGAVIDPVSGEFECRFKDSGHFSFRINASDGEKMVSTVFNVQVNFNNPPSFTQLPSDQNLSVGDIFNFQFLAYDQEGKPITFSIVEGTGATINASTGAFSYLATSIGDFNFKIAISDGFSAGTVSFKINVRAANTAPAFIDPPGAMTAYVNQTFKYQFRAEDKDNDPVTFSILNPQQIQEATMLNGLLYFNARATGTFHFTVVANDGKLNTNLDVQINVLDFPDGIDDLSDNKIRFEIYPNPFGENTIIEFALNKKQDIRLVIFDSMGRQVALVAQGIYETGKHTFTFDGTALTDGIYIGKLQTAEGTKTIKLVKQ